MNFNPPKPNMFLKNIPISDMSSTLKITKLNTTSINVYACDNIPFFKYFFKNSFSIVNNIKKYLVLKEENLLHFQN